MFLGILYDNESPLLNTEILENILLSHEESSKNNPWYFQAGFRIPLRVKTLQKWNMSKTTIIHQLIMLLFFYDLHRCDQLLM